MGTFHDTQSETTTGEGAFARILSLGGKKKESCLTGLRLISHRETTENNIKINDKWRQIVARHFPLTRLLSLLFFCGTCGRNIERLFKTVFHNGKHINKRAREWFIDTNKTTIDRLASENPKIIALNLHEIILIAPQRTLASHEKYNLSQRF